MGLLSNAIGQMIASMQPEERSEAIREVAAQALALMDAGERLQLTHGLFEMLVNSLDSSARLDLATRLSQRLAAPTGD
jgi:hypothetical protein